MKVGGWKTADIARRYDLGNREALRARIAAAREQAKVVRLADKRKARALSPRRRRFAYNPRTIRLPGVSRAAKRPRPRKSPSSSLA